MAFNLPRSLSRNAYRRLLLLAIFALVYLTRSCDGGNDDFVGDHEEDPGGGFANEERTIENAFRQRISGIMVEASGSVQRMLNDDNEGSRHQRFILALPSGHTVLVAHNIDLAPRVPLAASELVTLRGQYEWNEQGGVIHWTHHDPDGRHENGWIEYRSRRYR